MAYLTVTTAVDVVAPGDGKLSLREAITQANGSSGLDTIVFAANIEGTTLTLTQGELAVAGRDHVGLGRHRQVGHGEISKLSLSRRMMSVAAADLARDVVPLVCVC